MKRKKFLPYLFFPASALLVGGLSAYLAMDGIRNYAALNKPPLSPPAVVFPIAWTILYILMGLAAARIYRAASPKSESALSLYTLQLFLNFLWAPLFFGLEQRLPAFFLLLLLLFIVLRTAAKAFSIDRKAGWLLLPYILWLIFAAYLNAGAWLLNR